MPTCELCQSVGGKEMWSSAACRVVRVDDPYYPGFCRVIWNEHVREMTDLPPVQRQYLMSVVLAVEEVVRRLFAPTKINLASFGNMTPHLHWHVIPRWENDRHFPEPIWGTIRREDEVARTVVADVDLAAALGAALAPLQNLPWM